MMVAATAAAVMTLLASGAARAQEDVVATVKTSTASAEILLGGKSEIARPGVPVRRGSLLKTGKAGSIGLIFNDNTIVAIGPDTEVTVDEYLYAPSKGDLKLGATLRQGSLYYVSGVIARLRPDAVSIKTPTGTIGVRGTRFLARVEPEAAK